MSSQPPRTANTAAWSWGMLGLVLVLFLLTSVLLEPQLNRLSSAAQRLIGALTLVLPALAGVGFGVRSLGQPGARRLLGGLGALLNGLAALFFGALLLIAG